MEAGTVSTHTDGRTASIRHYPLLADGLFVTFLVIVAIGRWVVMGESPLPPGTDGGNWLAHGHAIFGEHIRSSSIVYPPVVPLLVVAAASIWGPFLGMKIVALLSSLAPAVGAYTVLRLEKVGWVALLCAAFLAPASSTGEAMAWGGYPQLIAIGLMVVFLWSADKYLRSPNLRRGIITGGLLAAAAATNELVGGITVAAGIVLVLLHIGFRPARRPPTSYLRYAPFVLLPIVSLIPIYLNLGIAFYNAYRSRPPGVNVNSLGVFASVEFLYRDFQVFWRVAIVLAVLVPVVLYSRRKTTLWMITSALAIPSVAIVFGLRELRFVYVLPPLAMLGLACWLKELDADWPWRRWLVPGTASALVLALLAQLVLGLQFFSLQAAFYRVLTPGLVQSMDWIREHTSSDRRIAVSATYDPLILGWWFEGLGRRRTVFDSNLAWLSNPDEHDRAVRAAYIFDRNINIDTARQRARKLGIDYILIDKAWPGYQDWSSSGAPLPADSVVIDNESSLLLRTSDPGATAATGLQQRP
jgi:hypothetical protein